MGADEDYDEYDDDDDPGYIREDIRGQEAFIARELDINDEDGSSRGADVYHQALAYRNQARAQLAKLCPAKLEYLVLL